MAYPHCHPPKRPHSNSPAPATDTSSDSSSSANATGSQTLQVPNEILDLIAFHSDKPTQASLIRVSSRTYHATAPHLYREVFITTKNAPSLFRGLARSPYLPRSSRVRKFKTPSSKTNGKSDQPAVLLWPSICIESEDEADEEDDDLSYVYPSIASDERTIKLLGLVRKITIMSAPSSRLSVELESWFGLAKQLHWNRGWELENHHEPVEWPFEFIGAINFEGGQADWAKMEKGIMERESHWAKEDFRITEWEDAEPCVCCGGGKKGSEWAGH
ncbi:hypothetical protein I302_105819 [Kwoniella bestiolae CBS 10118]|uniref:Uncharacterized protein n=1 Tax=Kwoniella bestiolae CBS 10118 TaxID=1296100 RepID=A0A1B9G294_9TREE|nr:hypothetical protein I302_04941 [Kwoniella bestiolae CBS 10118]OCF25131.1 hypothetical protein I302_04941 [Kwoniella bestiolae CBS 10118]